MYEFTGRDGKKFLAALVGIEMLKTPGGLLAACRFRAVVSGKLHVERLEIPPNVDVRQTLDRFLDTFKPSEVPV